MKTLIELMKWMKDNEYLELANELALIRYKADMWDKYNREARIHKELLQALEITETVHDARRIFDENREELTDLQKQAAQGQEWDSIKNPHAGDSMPGLTGEANNTGQLAAGSGDKARSFHDFKPAVKEFEEHKDETGHTYTGHDEEDVPGTARKGEN